MAINVIPTDSAILTDSLLEIDDSELEESAEQETSPEIIELKLPDSICGERLDKALSKLIPQYSRGRIQKWIEDGFVTVDGEKSKIKTTMLGDELVVIKPQAAPDEGAFSPEDIPIQIVYEDESILEEFSDQPDLVKFMAMEIGMEDADGVTLDDETATQLFIVILAMISLLSRSLD